MKKFYLFLNVFFLNLFFVYSVQAQIPQEELLEKFSGYFSVQKEVAYLHLNKSLFLQGEQLGFAAYVVNKSDLKPSEATSNLYVQIRNEDGKILSEEVLLIENGVGSGVVNIDTDFLPGDYTVTAFTNWMRNFDERNYFSEKIKVLESNIDYASGKKDPLEKIDVQFLPESGHLLANVLNQVGVVVKDINGHGLSNATVLIQDSEGKTIRTVSLNEFGIGRFSITPKENERFRAVVQQGERKFPASFNTPVEETGVIISTTQRNSDLRLQVSTNATGLARLQDVPFIMTVQGRNLLETFEIKFEDRENISFLMDLNEMDPGVNIITIFDSGLEPVAERLVFNHNRLPVEKSLRPEVIKSTDTLEFKFAFASEMDRILSISILPEKTVSYDRDNNILSYNFLQPYVKGNIENGGWYFEDVDAQKMYELDNLLLTQGWSSYDWDSIFEDGPELVQKAESFLGFEAQIVNKALFGRDQKFVVHATSVNPIDYFEIPRNSDKFIYEGFKALEGESLIMSRMKKNNDLVPAGLSLRFFPNKVPDFKPATQPLPQKIQQTGLTQKITETAYEEDFMEGFEELGEVTLEHKRDKDKERERKLDRSAFSRVSVVTADDLRIHQTLADYLQSRSLRVIEDSGTIQVFTTSGEELAFFLDGMRLYDAGILANMPIHHVDYVDIDKVGLSNRVRGGKGSVSVYTDKTGRHATVRDRNSIQEFEIPLTYSRKKTFYTPKYENTSDEFFQKFGVIDWKPELVSRNGEDISFFTHKPKVDYKLIMEGMTSDGTFIQEVHSFSADELE